MGSTYDIVIAGGGHNGLLAGAYLAKAGLSVCVLEKQPWVGGGAVTRELTIPGFKHDECSVGHMLVQPNPLIANDELKLISKYGLKYIYPDTATSVLFPDDSHIAFYSDLDKTCECIAKFSERDAEAYRKFSAFVDQAYDFLTMGMFNPPGSFGATAAILDESDFGREILRALTISQMDVCDDWFESEVMRIACSRVTSEGMISPQTKGTGIVMFWYFAVVHKYGLCVPEGGSGQISESLRRCLEDLGGEVRTSTGIESFKISGGECTGVVLEGGEEIFAKKAVVSSLNIRQLPGLMGSGDLPEDYVSKINRTELSEYYPFHIEMALNEAPKFKADMDEVASSFVELCPKNRYEYLKTFDDLKLGIPTAKIPLLIVPTIFDKTRAPEGKHCLYDYNYAPYDLKDGGPGKWDDIKEKFIQDSLAAIRAQTTNMGEENVLGVWARSPLDLERHNPSYPRGDFMHIGTFLHQAMGNRPFPTWNYNTPIKKLYICGASTHPGPGVNGASRAAMPVIMEDLGIDFEEVIS